MDGSGLPYYAAKRIPLTREHIVRRLTGPFATDVAGHRRLGCMDQESRHINLLVECQPWLAADDSECFSPHLLACGSVPTRLLRSKSRDRINMDDDAVGKEKKQAAWTGRSDVRNACSGLVQQETVVLLVDLVESVRLMREHEASTVRRWADFARIVTAEILPRHRGVLVKSLGDGLMARFEAVPDAVNAAA
jgi:hypothetical protein